MVQVITYVAKESIFHEKNPLKVYSAKYEQALPNISSSEIEIGPLLSHGGFSDVLKFNIFA